MKPEALFAELARHYWRQHQGEKMTGHVVRFTFPNGDTEDVPLSIVRKITASQRGRLSGMVDGKLGGRPTKRPLCEHLFLLFGDHWLRSGHAYGVARRTFLRYLRREYKVTVRTARRWADAVLEKRK